jgi:proline racemase
VIALKTIDAHVSGQPLRLIVDGFPAPRGRTMPEKRAWAARHADLLRRVAMLEPRGHRDMRGAVLTEPTAPGSHAGLLFMDGRGFCPMSGHAVIGAATIALERNLLVPGGDGCAVTFDTPAGTVQARAERTPDGIASVCFGGVPSFVLFGGVAITVGARALRVDVAFGGAFYAIVDGESAGLPLDAEHAADLRRAGTAIARAAEAAVAVAHPLDRQLDGLQGTIFIGPPRGHAADLRSVTVFADAAVSRSPSGTGTCAVMAVLDAMGLLEGERPFAQESIIGTTLTGCVKGRTMVGEHAAIVPEITGSAWITGEHLFQVHDRDPLREGFQL